MSLGPGGVLLADRGVQYDGIDNEQVDKMIVDVTRLAAAMDVDAATTRR